MAGEFTELRRVLLWDIAFANTPARPFLPQLYIPSTRSPSLAWMRAHAEDVQRLDTILSKYEDSMLSFARKPLVRPSHPAHTMNWKEIDNYFQHALLVEGDKDGSLVLVSIPAYQATVARQMASIHPMLRTPNYALLDPAQPRNIAFWERIGESWQNFIKGWTKTLFGHPREPTQDLLLTFLDRQPTPKLPQFYLLAKTHKWKQGEAWAGRPIVGMARWATTGVSRWLGVLAQLLLRLDAIHHPLSTPLQDALDVTHRIETVLPTMADACMTTVDFEALYTNLTLQDALHAITFWETRWREGILPLEALSEVERDLLRFSFSRIPPFCLRSILEQPELRDALPPGRRYTIAHLFMACVFKFSIFVAPGLGIYKQLNSFAMGTNCAPSWANAILRMYEIEHAHSLTRFNLFARYIDDIVIVHTPLPPDEIQRELSQVYPPHLPFALQQTGAHREVRFLDLFILSLQPFVHCIGWKETHKGVYIPWSSNTPRSIKLAWIRGETIRMLRLSSTKELFEIAYSRLTYCLQRLGYPKETHTPKKLTWEDRPFYLKYKTKKDQVTHLLRVPYHQRLAIPWGRRLGGLRNELAMHPGLKPDHRLYLSLKPPPTLRQILHRKMMKALAATQQDEHRPLPPNASAFIRAFHHVVYNQAQPQA